MVISGVIMALFNNYNCVLCASESSKILQNILKMRFSLKVKYLPPEHFLWLLICKHKFSFFYIFFCMRDCHFKVMAGLGYPPNQLSQGGKLPPTPRAETGLPLSQSLRM